MYYLDLMGMDILSYGSKFFSFKVDSVAGGGRWMVEGAGWWMQLCKNYFCPLLRRGLL